MTRRLSEDDLATELGDFMASMSGLNRLEHVINIPLIAIVHYRGLPAADDAFDVVLSLAAATKTKAWQQWTKACGQDRKYWEAKGWHARKLRLSVELGDGV